MDVGGPEDGAEEGDDGESVGSLGGGGDTEGGGGCVRVDVDVGAGGEEEGSVGIYFSVSGRFFSE